MLYGHPVQAGSQAAQDFVGDGAALLGYLACRDLLPPVGADDYSRVSWLDPGNPGDVHDGLVHTDPADDGGPVAAD